MPEVWTVTTAPTDEPVTLLEIKAHLRVDIAEDDEQITAKGKAARMAVEAFTGLVLMNTELTIYLDEWPYPADDPIILPRAPLLAVSSISYVDPDGNSQTLGTSIYTVDTDGARIYLAPDQSWPSLRGQRKAITIVGTFGYSSSGTPATARAAVPEDLREGVLMFTEGLYDARPDVMEAARAHIWPRRREWVG